MPVASFEDITKPKTKVPSFEELTRPVLGPPDMRTALEQGEAAWKLNEDLGIALEDADDIVRAAYETSDPRARLQIETDRRRYQGFFDELGKGLERGGERGISGVMGTGAALLRYLAGNVPESEKNTMLTLPAGVSENIAQSLYEDAQRWSVQPGEGGGIKGFVAATLGDTLPLFASATVATVAAGPAGAWTVTAMSEGDNAYRQAVADGASPEQAELTRVVVGSVNGVIEMAQVGHVLRLGKRATDQTAKRFAREVSESALKRIAQRGGRITVDVVKSAVQEGFEEVAQGWVGDGSATLIYGKDFNLQQRLEASKQEFVGGATAGILLGGGSLLLNGALAQATKPAEGGQVQEEGGYTPIVQPMAMTEEEYAREIATQEAAAALPAEAPAPVVGGEAAIETPAPQVTAETPETVAESATVQGQAKQPWEMTKEEVETVLRGSDLAARRPVIQALFPDIVNREAPDPKGGDFSTSLWGEVNEPSRYGEGRVPFPWVAEAQRTLLKEAVQQGRPVPRTVLEEYANEPWADEALAKMEPEAAPGGTEETATESVTDQGQVQPGPSGQEPTQVQTQRSPEAGGTAPPQTPPPTDTATAPAQGPSPEEAIRRLKKALRNARKMTATIRREQKATLKQRVGKAAGMMETLIAQGVPAAEARTRAMSALGGPQTEYANRYPAIRDDLGDATMNALHTEILQDGQLQFFERTTLSTLLDKLVDGSALTLHQARLLGDYFGAKGHSEIAKLASEHVPMEDSFWYGLMEALNVPRTLLASGDVSGILRQGYALAVSHPAQGTEFAGAYWKAWWSEEFAVARQAELEADPMYEVGKSVDLQLLDLDKVDAHIADLAEEFTGARLVGKVPGVRRAERSFVVALNQLRLAIFSRYVHHTEIAKGRTLTTEELRHLATAINNFSGRSKLPKSLRSAAPLFNAMFFSPRFFLSRLAVAKDVPLALFRSVGEITVDETGKRHVRLRAQWQPELTLGIRSVAAMIAANIGLMYLIKMLWPGDEEIELEPDLRATDGGKIVHGKMHIDPWAGYLTAARFIVRMATGQIKTQSGEIREVDRKQLFVDFLRSKNSPLAGAFIDWIKGENMVGQPFGSAPKGKIGDILDDAEIPDWLLGAGREVLSRTIPLVVQDAFDALTTEGVPEGVTAFALTFGGAGVATYDPSLFAEAKDIKNAAAEAAYRMAWDDLAPSQQEWLRQTHSDIEAAELKAKREAYPITSLDLTEQQNVARRIAKRLSDRVRTALNEKGIATGISHRILGDFWLNEARYKEYERRAAINIERRVQEALEVRTDLQKAVDKARAEARTSLVEDMEAGKL
jgi:hypothetical protein